MKQIQKRWMALFTAGMMGLTMTSALADAEKLPAPQNVVLNYGDNAASSTDDTISFDAVEGAVSYKVYVYQDGDTTAKVTQGTETTLPLAYPLDAGDYHVFVVAVGDGEKFDSSAASAKVDYTVEEEKKEPLGQVSDIQMDFTKVDPDNSVYPTISFTGVENAGRYLVDIYKANAAGEKQLTNLGYTTRLTVPAAQASGYMMDQTNYAALVPGYYIVSVTAYSNNANYANGEAVEALVSWIGVEAVKPAVTATEPENGGLLIGLDNYDSYNPGIDLIISLYADKDCTTLVKQEKMTYTTSEFFGNVTHKCKASFEVKDAADAKDGDLTVGTEYYATVSLDPEFYVGAYVSEPVAITCQKAGEGTEATSGGMGGGMGFDIKPTDASFDEGVETFKFQIGDHDLLKTTANLVEAEEGDKYTYKLEKGDPNAPFDPNMVLHLKEDGTAVLNVEAAGPIAGAKKTGTWTVADGVITMAW